jgi:hypothetical protein
LGTREQLQKWRVSAVSTVEGGAGSCLWLIFYTTVSEVIDYQRVAVLETA